MKPTNFAISIDFEIRKPFGYGFRMSVAMFLLRIASFLTRVEARYTPGSKVGSKIEEAPQPKVAAITPGRTKWEYWGDDSKAFHAGDGKVQPLPIDEPGPMPPCQRCIRQAVGIFNARPLCFEHMDEEINRPLPTPEPIPQCRKCGAPRESSTGLLCEPCFAATGLAGLSPVKAAIKETVDRVEEGLSRGDQVRDEARSLVALTPAGPEREAMRASVNQVMDALYEGSITVEEAREELNILEKRSVRAKSSWFARFMRSLPGNG